MTAPKLRGEGARLLGPTRVGGCETLRGPCNSGLRLLDLSLELSRSQITASRCSLARTIDVTCRGSDSCGCLSAETPTPVSWPLVHPPPPRGRQRGWGSPLQGAGSLAVGAPPPASARGYAWRLASRSWSARRKKQPCLWRVPQPRPCATRPIRTTLPAPRPSLRCVMRSRDRCGKAETQRGCREMRPYAMATRRVGVRNIDDVL